MKSRYYIVKCDSLQEASRLRDHSQIIVDRPTPWKLFLSGFLHPKALGFAVIQDDELGRLLSNRYAITFYDDVLRSNGDSIHVQKWDLLNVCKFCIEGFQYKTFLRFWEWTWKP